MAGERSDFFPGQEGRTGAGTGVLDWLLRRRPSGEPAKPAAIKPGTTTKTPRKVA